MSSPASVGGDERVRLFLGLQLPPATVEAVVRWQEEHLRGVRLVRKHDLHLTLAFLGHRPAAELDPILDALRDAAAGAAAELRLAPVRYRETRSVAMVVFEDDGGRVTAVADDVQGRLERLGVYRREGRPWLPHLTVARFRERPRLRLEPPVLEPFAPSDAAAYLSRLRRGGAQYEILESVALGGR